MTTIDEFLNMKNTKSTYFKVLSIAQENMLKKTIEFTQTGIMPETTRVEAEINSLCDILSQSFKLPKAVRDLNNNLINGYVELSKKYPRF